LDGNTTTAGKTEICQFELALTVDEPVPRLEISAYDHVGMAEFNTRKLG
jgi:hypothetical protein